MDCDRVAESSSDTRRAVATFGNLVRPCLMRSATLLLLLPAAVTACDPPRRAPPPPDAQATVTATATSPLPAPPPPPDVTITNLTPGELEIVSSTGVKLAGVARIERKVDTGWAPLAELDGGKGYRLVERCQGADPPACVDLRPSSAIHPVPFRGFGCSSQCNDACRANVWEGPGTFRMVVSTCDGVSVAGPPFQLPGPEHASSLLRWGLATDVTRAWAMRLDRPAAGWNGASPPAPGRLAGFTVRAGSERLLDEPEVTGLLERLRAPGGYDDQIAKRCAMDHLVGFRLARRPATTGAPLEDEVEIAVDFACQKLFAVRGGARGSARTVHATHFDPSRAAFLTLARRALVDDAELGKLR